MDDEGKVFIKGGILKQERNSFIFGIILVAIGYYGLSAWLNSIRVTAPILLVWILIAIQFTLYFLIFIISYKRLKVLGWKSFALPISIVLAILGRINDWEILILPSVVIIMILLSIKNKNISNTMQGIVK